MPRKRKLPEGLEHLAKYDPKDFPPEDERPIVAEYDCSADEGTEALVHRPMDDLEYADMLYRQDLAAEEAARPVVHPLVAQVASMSDEDKAALAAALK